MALQLILFFVVSALSLAAFRPIVQKYINNKVEATNVDSIIGREVLVTEKISNLQAAGAFSGYGAPQGIFAVESCVNELADMLKRDPTELRLQNMVSHMLAFLRFRLAF